MYVVRAAPGGYFTYLLTLTTSGSRSQVILLDFMSRNGTSFKTHQQNFLHFIACLVITRTNLYSIDSYSVAKKATLKMIYPISLKINRPKNIYKELHMCSLALLFLEYDKYIIFKTKIVVQNILSRQNIYLNNIKICTSLWLDFTLYDPQNWYKDLRIFQASLKQLGLSNWYKLQKINSQIKSITLETAKCKFGAKMLSRQ